MGLRRHLSPLSFALLAVGCGFVGLEPVDLDVESASATGGDPDGGDGDGDGDGDLKETGGSDGSGGAPSGGRPNTGGGFATGGVVATGGVGATGGMPVTGGRPGTGGNATMGGFGGASSFDIIYSNQFNNLEAEHFLQNGTTMKIVEGRVESGTAVEIVQGGIGGGSGFYDEFTPYGQGEELHARMWLRVLGGSVDGELQLLSLDTDFNHVLDVRLFEEGVVSTYLHEADVPESSEVGAHPYDQWFCLQMSLFIHNENGSVELFVDEKEVLGVFDVDTSLPLGVSEMNFGMAFTAEGQTGGHLWIDDFVLAEEEIPCNYPTPQ